MTSAALQSLSRKVPASPARGSLVVRAMKAAITLSMLLLIYNDIFGGVIKYYSATSALLFISFIPSLFAGAVLAAYFGSHILVMRIHNKMVLFLLIFVLNAIYALADGRNPAAVGFGFYIWLPFFVGLLITTFKLEKEFEKHIIVWWVIVTAGVLLNSQIKFPWTGESYQVLGQTIQASRDWTASGFDRLAGFSRASFAAATQIALFCMVMLAMRIGVAKKVFVWAISTTAVYLTTTKTTLFIMIMAPILIGMIDFFLTKSATPQAPNRKIVRLATIICMFLAGLMVGLPIFSLTSASNIVSSEGIGFFNLYSLYDRMGRMWPQAWDLILDQGNPIHMIFGRGIGGIGTPQNFFEALKSNSADNLFVYLYVTFGIFSIFFIRHLIINIRKWAEADNRQFLTYFALTVSILIIGLMANVVENPTSLLVLGLLIGKTSSRALPPANHNKTNP